MTTAIRLLTALILLTGGLASAGSMHPALATVLGWQAVPQEQRDSFVVKGQITVQRVHAKEQVIQALMAGELGLFEAAAWFRELNLTPPEHPDERWQNLPGRSEEEKLCRQVMCWVRVGMEDTMTASQLQSKMQELEAELKAHIARHGKVILPAR
jgi:hypothetical protein